MKKIWITILYCTIAFLSIAQPSHHHQRGERGAKLRTFKVAYLTETLALSPQDSVKFWAVYEKYEHEKRELRKQVRKHTQGLLAKSDDQLKKELDGLLDLRQKEIEIERKYMGEFLKVISLRQVAALYHAENQLKKKIIERLGELGQGHTLEED